MQCPNCQVDISEDSKFCKECGTKLTSTAPDFQSLNEKIDKIQRYLPKGITDKILSQKDRIEGERKQVTVLFCDLVGFTVMSDKLGAESTYSVMDQVLEILIHKVHDYGGTVNQLLGDGLYALFGVPIAIEDASSRAIRAGIDMHQEITSFSNGITQDLDIAPLRLRIGINSGPVVVGTIGNTLRVDFTAVGDTVNLASRMEGIAEPGTVFVTEETYRQARLYFEFESLGGREVKGKEDPVSVYKVLSEKEKVHRRLTSERIIQSEMVGRENELDQLALLALRAKDGEGSIVNVIGEAGIGKSRLIAEFTNHDAVKEARVLEGRALSMGRNLSFYPIIEILKRFAGIGDDDTAKEQLYKLERSIRDIHPQHADEIIPFVGSLMGMQLTGKYAERVEGIEGEALEKLVFKNLRDFLLKSAEVSPLVFIIEDLHWADTSSIELIISLCRLVENNKILIINIFRPHFKETGEKLKIALEEEYPSMLSEITLHSLDSDQSDQLISNLLKIEGLPINIRDEIKERSEGNPFFIEEMARSMIDEGAIEIQDGKFSVTGRIDTVVVPNTIQELLMSRIDKLDENTKSLLRKASVIGRHFFYKILSEVAESVEDIDEKLSYLQEIQLIREGRRKEEIEYLFKHALAQKTTYESILQEKRKELHRQVAESLERVFSEKLSEFYGMLAYHFVQADNLVKAEEYMIKAGREAMKSSASSEALVFFQHALSLYLTKTTVDQAKVAELEENIAFAFYIKGRFNDAVYFYDRTIKSLGIREPESKTRILVTALSFLAKLIITLYVPFGNNKKIIPTHLDERLVKIGINRGKALSWTDHKRLVSSATSNLIAIRFFQFDMTKSLVFFDGWVGISGVFVLSGSYRIGNKIIDYIRTCVSKSGSSVQSQMFGYIEVLTDYLTGNYNSKLNKNQIENWMRNGDLHTPTMYLYYLGLNCLCMGQYDTMQKSMDLIHEISVKYDYPIAKVSHQSLLLRYLADQGQLDEAMKYVDDGIDNCIKLGLNRHLVVFEGYKTIIELHRNNVEPAKMSLSTILGIEKSDPNIPSVILANKTRASFIYHLTLLREALRLKADKKTILENKKFVISSGKEALRQSRKLVPLRAETYRRLGVLYGLLSNQKRAVVWLARSIKEAKKLGARPDLSRTYMEVGKRLMEPKSKYKQLNGITAEGYLEKARVMFEEMDLQWDLEQLEKVKRGEQVPIV